MRGILLICSQPQEWMLPWWWMHYHFHNSFPVIFIDLGISNAAKVWCAKRGEVISLDPTQFEKSQAMRLSPFDKTLLLDLDAQVCCPLGPLFDLSFSSDGTFPKKYRCGAEEPHGPDISIVDWSGTDKSSIRGAMAICEKLLMNLTFEES